MNQGINVQILNGHKFSSVHATNTGQVVLRCIWGVLSNGIFVVPFEHIFSYPYDFSVSPSDNVTLRSRMSIFY